MGFTFNDVHSSAYNLLTRTVARPLYPGNTDSYMTIPGRDGAVLAPGNLKDREYRIKCIYGAGGLDDLRARAHDIAAWLNTEERQRLSFDDEAGLYTFAKLSDAVTPEQFYGAANTFELRFTGDPFMYGDDVTETLTSASSYTMSNAGTAASRPVFTATLAAGASEVIVTDSAGRYVKLEGTFLAGDVLIMDLRAGVIKKNGAVDMGILDWANSDLENLLVKPGSNTFTPGSAAGSYAVMWTPQYI